MRAMTGSYSARTCALRPGSRLCCACGIFNLFVWHWHSDCVVWLPDDV